MTEDKFKKEMERFYKRDSSKDRIIVVQGLIILLLLVGGVMYATYQARTLKDQIATAIAEYMRLNPIQAIVGSQGEKGLDGASQELRVNELSCSLQSRSSDSDFWRTLAILPRPCT